MESDNLLDPMSEVVPKIPHQPASAENPASPPILRVNLEIELPHNVGRMEESERMNTLAYALGSALRNQVLQGYEALATPDSPPIVARIHAYGPEEEQETQVFSGDEMGQLRQRFGLSPRETEILELTAKGKSSQDIADSFGITAASIRQSWRRMYRKLGTVRKPHAVVTALLSVRPPGPQFDIILDTPAEETSVDEEEESRWSPPSPAFEEHRRPPKETGLTIEENEIVALIARGFSDDELAEWLGLSLTAAKDDWRCVRGRLKALGHSVSRRVQAVAAVYEITGSVPEASVTRFKLGDRQAEVAQCVMQGLENSQIATELEISEDTVKRHLRNLFRKTRARDRTHLVAILYEVVDSPKLTGDTE